MSRAETSLSELSKNWTGLIVEQGQVKRFTLKLDASATASAVNRSQPAMRRGSGNGQDQTMQLGSGEPIAGQVILDVAKIDAFNTLPAPAIYPLTGELIAELNLLKIQYQPHRQPAIMFFGAISENKDEIYLFFGGPQSNQKAPILLVAGNTLPDYMQRAVGAGENVEEARLQAIEAKAKTDLINQQVESLRIQGQQARAEGNSELVAELRQKINDLFSESAQINAEQNRLRQEAMAAQQKARLEKEQYKQKRLVQINKKMQDVQTQIAQERQAGNQEAINSLTQQMLLLRKQQQDVASGRHPELQQKAGSGCLPSLVAWLDEFNKNKGASAQSVQIIQLINLFRPSVFNRYFEQSLLDMDDELRDGYVYELGRVCSQQGNLSVRRSHIKVVSSGFGEIPRVLHYMSAAIGGMALDGAAAWQAYTMDELAKANESEALSEFEIQSSYVRNALWPEEQARAESRLVEQTEQTQREAKVVTQKETAQAETKLVELKERPQREGVYAEIDARIKAAQNGELRALMNAIEPRTLSSWNAINLTAQDEIRGYINSKLPGLLTNYFSIHTLPADTGYAAPEDALLASRTWFEQHKDLYVGFRNQPAVSNTFKQLFKAREPYLKQASQNVIDKIKTTNSVNELNELVKALFIRPDKQHSSTWQVVNGAKQCRMAELELIAYRKRVGDGPLEADDDGAVYINALYRNDMQIIAEEDKKFERAMVEATEPLLNSGVIELTSLFMGRQSDPQAIKQEMRDSLKGISMSTAMTGFFIVSYEHLAAKCLGPNPVEFTRTEVWDDITRTVMGEEVYRNTYTQTYHYTIARRHADIFKQLGEGTNANNVDALANIYGASGMISADAQKSLFTMSDNLRGVATTMQRYACDSEEMKTLESALIGMTRARL
ncbi:hypothetical protein C6Y40_12615 [Alteromonas alba]|uniref:Uncharacterized protein n=3 Tax=Gammaproteobacteria TaxID=1236 RepID=A0A2S9V9X6_9ALTE|nr:hypothetical protein [Alteromonas alba]PRO73224.1 hypothetical protein C6Y40_12615 [Alteromonas alba]